MQSRSSVKQVEVTRAVAGAKAAGLEVERVEVDPINGKVVIHAKGAPGASGNPWDALHR